MSWPEIPPRCSWRTCRAPATHDITAGAPCTCWPGKKQCRCPGYASSYACRRDVDNVGWRNLRRAGRTAIAVELDRPIQPVLDLGEL